MEFQQSKPSPSPGCKADAGPSQRAAKILWTQLNHSFQYTTSANNVKLSVHRIRSEMDS